MERGEDYESVSVIHKVTRQVELRNTALQIEREQQAARKGGYDETNSAEKKQATNLEELVDFRVEELWCALVLFIF